VADATTKPWWQSKTFWFGVAQLILAGAEHFADLLSTQNDVPAWMLNRDGHADPDPPCYYI
jgi:hypothetical protein